MVNLIDRDALRKKYCDCCAVRPDCMGSECKIYNARCLIEDLPTIEAEPIRHAYWEPSEIGEYHCTHCGVECDIDQFHKALLNPFCGNCGAVMDGGSENGLN